MRKLKDQRRPEILDAAIAITDEAGPQALSMRAVAQHLGLTPMALYGYFRNKDELLDGIVGHLLAASAAPDLSLTWDEQLRQLAHGIRRVARRHPAMFPLLLTRPAVSPSATTVIETVFRALLEAGVPHEQIPRYERLLGTFILGHMISEVTGRFAVGSLNPRARRAQLEPDALPAHQLLADHLDAPVDWDQEFAADLEDVLGLIRAAASQPEPQPEHRPESQPGRRARNTNSQPGRSGASRTATTS